jgi:hypothetical protein
MTMFNPSFPPSSWTKTSFFPELNELSKSKADWLAIARIHCPLNKNGAAVVAAVYLRNFRRSIFQALS